MPRALKKSMCSLRQVVADDADEAHVGEKLRGQREVRGRAAEQAFAAVGGRFDVIDGDGADDDKRHGD